MAAQTWRPYHHETAGKSVVQRASCPPQRCKNSRNESCVIASESGITSPVTLRVGHAGTCELIALHGKSGLDRSSTISHLCVSKWLHRSGDRTIV